MAKDFADGYITIDHPVLGAIVTTSLWPTSRKICSEYFRLFGNRKHIFWMSDLLGPVRHIFQDVGLTGTLATYFFFVGRLEHIFSAWTCWDTCDPFFRILDLLGPLRRIFQDFENTVTIRKIHSGFWTILTGTSASRTWAGLLRCWPTLCKHEGLK